VTSPRSNFELVRLPNGTHSVYAADYAEKMHPGLGPQAEADLLYVQQLKLPERMRAGSEEFVVWDIGLGAAANALAVLQATKTIDRPLRLVSFDNTAEPLAFALENATQLEYLEGHQDQLRSLLDSRRVEFQNGRSFVEWEFHLGDFPAWLERRTGAEVGTPHAILFDAFSPAKNPAMWTLPLFTNLFRALDPARPCNLTTYSRSTMFRVTLLLAGFYVGSGVATGLKEETTVAANDLRLVAKPLDQRWLERARRSDSAEPLTEPNYRRARLSDAHWEKLRAHPQFQP
jgi:tRNA U34 5-methylaminomethyl-2-thiouridine-forming methyltransferase MnmC